MQKQSIAKAQARYLQTLHLDQIGESKSSLEAFELPEVEEALLSMAAYLKAEAEKNLSDSNAVSSGNLVQKITFEKVRYMSGTYQLEVSLPNYYKFINSGVNGLKVKHGSPYAFKNMFVSKAMLNNLRKWVIREGLKARTKPAMVDPTRQEQKGRLVNSARNSLGSSLQTAFIFSKAIKKNGIKPTRFWDKATDATYKRMKQGFGTVFVPMIVNELKKK